MASKKSPARLTDSPAPNTDSAKTGATASPFTIVGLGASAGGLEAFEQFFRKMPADSGMAFVLVQHLDPHHPSILAEIVQRSASMPVIEAQNQVAVEPNHVYVIPPNRDMVIFNGALQLSVPTEPHGQRMPIDAFLRSLAEDRGADAAGIILSGTGTDGTLGMRAIFGAGGLCLAQEPSTAKYDGMPGSVIRAGYTSRVLAVEQMPQALFDGTRPRAIRQIIDAPAPTAASGLIKILMQLRSTTGHDFSQYKVSTIGRRIERRMALHNIDDTELYARYLKAHPAEVQLLFRELLINVTSFFRDPLAFVELKTQILPTLLADKADTDALRIWVAGCATGEEAYSIAMLLREQMDETHREFKVQLYSTDLDSDAIDDARAGHYLPNIEQDVSPERLRRFFIRDDSGYRIKKEIREMVVFAVQSVIKDPPFTRLDLLACRNLMIYLEPELQNRLIPAFHYALKPGGVLFLSPSESIGGHTELFEPIHRKWKFYRARPTAASARAVLNSGLSWATDGINRPAQDTRPVAREPQIADLARRTLLQSFAPAAVVTDLQGHVLYVHGETGKFLRPAPGHPSSNVVDMARSGLQLALREAIQLAATQGVATQNRDLSVKTDHDEQRIHLSVRPMQDPEGRQSMLLVSFQERPQPSPPAPVRKSRGKASEEALRVAALESELSQAKESMTAMLEEQQASNEELKSTNEELQSTNEELQSTNEELETSKEELQSVNEELVTVNAELQTKIEQMASMQDDMKNLLDNIRLGTVFLDRHLVIRRFTHDATQIFRLVKTDVGRPLADIRCELPGVDLLADAQAVLESLVPIEREVRSATGTWYLARTQPYRTVDNVIDGVVLTFADVTERVQAIASRTAHELAVAVVDSVRDPLVVLDGKLSVISANTAFCEAFGVALDGTVGHNIFEFGNRQWDHPALHQLLEDVLPRKRSFEHQVVAREVSGGGARQLQLSARQVIANIGTGPLTLLTVERITDLKADA